MPPRDDASCWASLVAAVKVTTDTPAPGPPIRAGARAATERVTSKMKAMVGSLAGVGVGIVAGVIVAFGAQAAVAENSVPELETPPADQSLFGQVEYGSRG